MATEKIRHLVTKRNRDGSARHYWQPSGSLARAGWPARRLSQTRGAAIAEAEAINETLDAWRAGTARGPDGAAAPMPGARPATVAGLIAAFKRHRYYTDRKPKTKAWYDQNLRVIEAWAGDKPVLAIDRALVEELYESMRHRTPAKAAAVVSALRRVYEYGKIPFGETFANPAQRPNISTARQTVPELWPGEAVARFIAAADAAGRPSVGDMICYGEWLGHYPSDLIALTRANYAQDRFSFARAKTGARIHVPHSPAVAARVAAALARQRTSGVVSDYLFSRSRPGGPTPTRPRSARRSARSGAGSRARIPNGAGCGSCGCGTRRWCGSARPNARRPRSPRSPATRCAPSRPSSTSIISSRPTSSPARRPRSA